MQSLSHGDIPVNAATQSWRHPSQCSHSAMDGDISVTDYVANAATAAMKTSQSLRLCSHAASY